MKETHSLTQTIYDGWHTYQQLLIKALAPLKEDELELRAAPHLRSVRENALHIIGARARWFYGMDEEEDRFRPFTGWDRPGAPSRIARELVDGLEQTWTGMRETIGNWTEEDWQQTWPGDPGDEPEIITRQWVIWHLIEHDVHHGGEISLTLGVHGIAALSL